MGRLIATAMGLCHQYMLDEVGWDEQPSSEMKDTCNEDRRAQL